MLLYSLLGPNDTLRIPYDYAYKSALNRVFMNTWSKSTFERVLGLKKALSLLKAKGLGEVISAQLVELLSRGRLAF